MGYSTDFFGSITIEPPLNAAEVSYLADFSCTRHMLRAQGEHYVDHSWGQDYTGVNQDLGHHNTPFPSQPSLWCNFAATEDGKLLVWNESEKTQKAAQWIRYIINHFLKPGAHASKTNDPQFKDFTFDHVCNGQFLAQGEDITDRWKLIVVDNDVTTVELE